MLYAVVVVGEPAMILVNVLSTACCTAVFGVAARQRLADRVQAPHNDVVD